MTQIVGSALHARQHSSTVRLMGGFLHIAVALNTLQTAESAKHWKPQIPFLSQGTVASASCSDAKPASLA